MGWIAVAILSFFGLGCVILCLGAALHAAEENHLFEHHEPRERRAHEHAIHFMHSTSTDVTVSAMRGFHTRATSAKNFARRASFSVAKNTPAEPEPEPEPEFSPAPESTEMTTSSVDSVELGIEGAEGEDLTSLVETFAASTSAFEAKSNIENLTKKVKELPSDVIKANDNIKMNNLNAAAIKVKETVGVNSWNTICRSSYMNLSHTILNKMETTRKVPRARFLDQIDAFVIRQ